MAVVVVVSYWKNFYDIAEKNTIHLGHAVCVSDSGV